MSEYKEGDTANCKLCGFRIEFTELNGWVHIDTVPGHSAQPKYDVQGPKEMNGAVKSIQFVCAMCCGVSNEPGAILFSPPKSVCGMEVTAKHHICVTCYSRLCQDYQISEYQI